MFKWGFKMSWNNVTLSCLTYCNHIAKPTYRGYYTVAGRYEFYFQVNNTLLTRCARS